MTKEYYIEFRKVGMYLKATAMDPETLTEVSTLGPVNAQEALKKIVITKLENAIKNKPKRKPKNF